MSCLRTTLLVTLLVLLVAPGCQTGLFGGDEEPSRAAMPEVRFVGIQAVDRSDLEDAALRELRSFRERGGSRADAADAAYAMEVLLRERGFHESRVTFDVTGALVTFTVHEGPRALLATVSFTGHDTFSDEVLRPYFDFRGEGFLGFGLLGVEVPVYDTEALAGAVAQVETHYLLAGFQDVRIEDPRVVWNADRTRADVTVPIREGRRYVVSSVEVVGTRDPGLGLVGEPYHVRVPSQAAAAVRRALREAGHQFAEVDAEGVPDPATARVVVRVTARPGPVVRLGDVRVDGLDRTQPGFVRGLIPVERGDVIAGPRLERGVNHLFRTGLFGNVRTDLKRTGPDTADLEIQVKELPARSVEVEAGWGSYELARGAVRYRDDNLLGINRILEVEASGSLRSRGLEVNVIDPWILGSKTRVSVGAAWLFREEPTFDRTTLRFEAAMRRDLGGRWRLRAGYELELERASNVRGELAPEDRAGFVRTAGISADLRYDGRDDPFLPRRGTLLNGRVFWSTPALGADLEYLELDATAVTYLELDADTVLAVGGSLRTRKPLDGAETLPVQQRYFLGGESSVRSFEEQALSPLDTTGTATGGLTALEAHIELRRRLIKDLHGALFYDVGLVGRRAMSLDAELGHAVGVGLRYHLPIGPIRIDVAYGPGERFAATSRWAVHAGFGFSF